MKQYGLVPVLRAKRGRNRHHTEADYYADMPRWSFHSQCFFLAHKLELHQRL